jgi:hypothetical protein
MSGTYQWAKSYLALSAFFQFLILLWLLEKLNFLYKRKDRLFFACSAGFLLCSYQILFPIFEGSFGQHFSFLLFCLLLNRWRNPNLFFWMFVLFSIVFVYKDLILISIPFIASAIVSQEGHQLYSRFQKRPFFWLISISILVTTLFFFGGLSKRISTLSLGGWNEGVLPSVLDVFGILGAYTWEKQGISSLWFSTLSILLTLIAFVLVVRICKFSKKESLALTVVYLSFLFYSLVSVLNENNYVLWKTLPYYSIWTTWFILIRASKFKLDYIKMFLVLQIAMAIVFFQKWIQNSTRIEIYSLNENEIIKVNNLVDTFALDFREQKYLNVWALMGDMNWGIDTRQVRNQVSEMSDRRKVFVIPSQICRNAPDKEQVLIELKDSCIVRDPDDLSQKIP